MIARQLVRTLLLAVFALAAWAQSSNQGVILGTVTDESGSVIPGVRVTAVNVETGLERTTEGNAQGDFRFDFLPPGGYKVTAERAGFRKSELAGLTLRVGQNLRADIQLNVGALSQQVTVESDAAAVNTETANLGEVISSEKIQNLPLNGREYIALAALVPGAESGNPKRGAIDDKGYVIGFNGTRSSQNAFFFDGADNTDANQNQLISSPSVDAIKEFRVETNLYSAQYGRSGGAVISVVTNSGTNSFHGTVYDYHRNKVFDARSYFFTQPREKMAQFLFNQFGGTLGGPVVKNKLFFFGSYEGFRKKTPGSLMTTFAPTEKERVGDLTSTTNPWTGQPAVLYDPATLQPIPGNILPASAISKVGQAMMSLWPQPNYSGDPILNLRMFRKGSSDQNKVLGRVDYYVSNKDLLSGTFNFGNYNTLTPSNTIYGDTKNLDRDRVLVATYTHTFLPTLVSDLKFNFTKYNTGSDFVLVDKNYAKEWGLWSGTQTVVQGSPRVLMYTQGFTLFNLGNVGKSGRDNINVYVKDNLMWIKNRHSVLVGGDFRRQQYDWTFNDGVPATYYFGLYDASPAYNATYIGTGSTFTSVLTGISPRVTYGIGDGSPMLLRRNGFSLYFQDDWKVSSRLTVNLGLRYEFEQPFASGTNEFVNFDFDSGVPIYPAGAPKDKLAILQYPYETGGAARPFDPSKKNFGPRVGMAYRPFNNNSTVIRAGYGLFHTSEVAYNMVYGAWVNPFRGQFGYYSRATNWADGVDRTRSVDQQPLDYAQAQGANPGTFYATTPYYPTGYVQQYNLTVARDLGFKTILEISYVGSKGTNMAGPATVDMINPAGAQKMRQLIKNFSPVVRSKGFNSKYNSLQMKLAKELSHGFSLLSAFTWGHAMAESSNDATNENIFSDEVLAGSVAARRYSNADFDIRKRMVVSGVYELPFGRGKAMGSNWNEVVNGIAGGWTTNFILTFQDGYPFTVYDTATHFPNRVCDGNLPSDQRTPDKWFDYTCFVTQVGTPVVDATGVKRTINVQGNAAPNVIVGPGTNNIDFGLHKNFRLAERTRIQFRAEAFNIFNHPNLTAPSSNYFFNTVSGAKITRVRDNRSIQFALKLHF